MIVNKKNKRIFLNPNAAAGINISPRITKRTLVRSNESSRDELLEIEIFCAVDQRKMLDEEISDIRVFTSRVEISDLKKRKSVLSPDIVDRPSPSGLSINQSKSLEATRIPPAGSQFKRSNPRKFDSLQKSKVRLANQKKSLAVDSAEDRANFVNVVNDIDKISQTLNTLRVASLQFLTKINVNQFLSASKIKNIQNYKQTDDELFGTKEVFSVVPKLNLKGRNIRRNERNISLPTGPALSLIPISEINFRRAYFNKVHKGEDPLSSFQHSDNYMSLQESIKGIKEIDKTPDDELRDAFKKIINPEIGNVSEFSDLRIVKKRVSNRRAVYKGSFTILRSRLRSLGRGGDVNLIFYAYDQKGVKVDSFGRVLDLDSLLKTSTPPPLDFQVGVTRNNKGNIITSINNEELIPSQYKLYQKTFTKSQNFKRNNFSQLAEDVLVGPKSSINLIDGTRQTSGRHEIAKTKTVFHRVTSTFENEEISNTKTASSVGEKSLGNELTCGIYVESIDGRMKITVGNFSEGVRAVLPVKRKAVGKRGNDFRTVRVRPENSLINNSKTFLDFQDDEDKSLTFFDDDLQDDKIYEYAAVLYGKNGEPQLSASRFLEKFVERENEITTTIQLDGQPEVGINLGGKNFVENKFNIVLTRNENDVDKILNSLFGDNRQLFQKDLESIKDASNLIHGVRVHKIDTRTGEFSFVGSFRANSQSSPEDQPNTDLPKTFKLTFTDRAPIGQTTIYKFNPYVIPPSQVLDKVFDTLQNLLKNKNRSRLPMSKFLVSKQKIINRDVLSKVGTKYASIQGRKGAIASPKAFAEKNRNDLFLEGLTGDISYIEVGQIDRIADVVDFDLRSSNVSLLKSFDKNEDGTSLIPKNLVEINFTVGNSDVFVDFYVVLRRENNSRIAVIDGAIHSKDIEANQLFSSYRYLSKVKTSVGLISYFIVPVTKIGNRGPIVNAGDIILRGN